MILAYQQRASLKYLSKKYKWTSDQLTNIHWVAQSRTMKKFLHSPTICKLSNGILPLNHLLHRQHRSPSPLCPTCKLQVETKHHIFQCPGYKPWQTTFLSKLNGTLTALATIPVLREFILLNVRGYFQNRAPQYPASSMPILVGLKAQSALGWDQFFRGRITCYFQDIQDQFSPTRNANWTASLVRVLWTGFLNLWELRNAALHGDSLTLQQQHLLTRLQHNLKELYAQKHLMRPQDTRLFYDSVDAHLTHHRRPHQLQNWIRMATPTVRTSIRRAQRNITRTTARISTYFTPLFSPSDLHDNTTTQQKKKKKKKSNKKVPYEDTSIQRTLPQLCPLIPIPKLKPQEIQPWVPWSNGLTQTILKSKTSQQH